MSRRIKFRLWCKVNNEFVDPKTLGGILNYRYNGSLNSIFKDDTIEFQQFTGKTDKQNADIYEGDIVYLNHYDVPEVDKQCLFEIIFEDGAFKLKPIKLGQAPNGGVSGFFWMRYIEGWNADGDEKYRYELPPPQPVCGFNRMVVIGNIFENSELLAAV